MPFFNKYQQKNMTSVLVSLGIRYLVITMSADMLLLLNFRKCMISKNYPRLNEIMHYILSRNSGSIQIVYDIFIGHKEE